MDVQQLHFREWSTPAGVAPSALFDEPLTCAIYVLNFADGEAYVGQTVNFPIRFGTHRRRWQDITSVRFAPAAPDQLDDAERSMIHHLAASETLLRNRTLLSQALGSSPFDLVVDKEVQKAWLLADADSDTIEIDDDRIRLAKRRIESRARHLELQAHPLYEDVLDSVASYVASVIPWPHESEGRLWTVTVLPSTSRRNDHRRLLTLNIQNLEVKYVAETMDDAGEWHAYTVLNTGVMQEPPAEVSHLCEVTDLYRTAGDVHRFDVEGSDVVPVLLDIPTVRCAARQLALGQLRKGRGSFAHHHNDAFTDDVFARIGAWIDESVE